jgi:hypothetical protein
MSNDAAVRAAINAAEEVRDPLEGLLERTKADAGTAFSPEVLAQLAALKQDNRAAFETLRAQLKKAGCRVIALDEAIAEESGEADWRPPKHADILIELAQTVELFHAPDGTAFADLDINSHRETWPIRSRGFRRWLARRFFEETGGAPGSEALQSALNVIEAKAHYDAPERVVHVRVAGLNGKLYLDLGDVTWRAVEIDATGWRVIDNPPVRFRRASGMGPLPVPVPGGSIEALRTFLNVRSSADFVLVIVWVLACLRNHGPYPVIVLSGEQGSAKSTFSAILRALVDPNVAALRALPREDHDLFIAASNSHVLAFDNVSGLPGWVSDTLCRLSTGGGFAVRQLYTDSDEVLFDAARPVILNGIEDIVTRPDLADRALFLTLEPIPEELRRAEADIWAAFEAERPRVLGALLDAVVEGLKCLPGVHLPKLPRMADFALWASACETALWPGGTFWAAYCGNRDEAVEGVIEADPIAAAVRALMATRTEWRGPAAELLGALAEQAGERVAKSKTWPDSPRALAGRLRRTATFLRKIGIDISFSKEGRARTRMIRITTTFSPAPDRVERRPSAPSVSSAPNPNSNAGNGFTPPKVHTIANDADGPGDGGARTVRAETLNCNEEDRADGADANPPTQSMPREIQVDGSPVSAAEILKAARAAGVEVRIEGNELVLEAIAAPPAEIVEQLAHHKSSILVLLRPGRDGWSTEDWLAFFDERAGIAEFDHGLPRQEAEARAFDCCVAKWLNRNPAPSIAGRCCRCGRVETSDASVLPYGTEAGMHAWLHAECWTGWQEDRRSQAIQALSLVGLNPDRIRSIAPSAVSEDESND